MNKKEAKDIDKKSFLYEDSDYYVAQGYLEAIEKTKELERIIRERMLCIYNPQNDITCVRCDTLKEWEKKK